MQAPGSVEPFLSRAGRSGAPAPAYHLGAWEESGTAQCACPTALGAILVPSYAFKPSVPDDMHLSSLLA